MTIKDPAGLAWFGRNMLLTLLGKELTEILFEKKQQKIMALDLDIVPRTMSRIIKQDLVLSNDEQDNVLLFH